jgi:hypothetical protein
MANNVSEWSTTAADNTSLGAVSLQENIMLVNRVNNAFRELMAQVAGAGLATGDTASTAGNIAVFADTTGKAIEDSGYSIVDEDDMSSDSATKVPTQQSVKAYVDANAGVDAASQAEQETGTEAAKYVAPATQQYHASAAKCWALIAVSGGVPALQQSYNVTSLTDDAVARITINIATDFSSSLWVPIVGVLPFNTTYGASQTVIALARNGTRTAGAVTVDALVVNTTPAQAANDPDAYVFLGFGDQ